MSAAIIVAGIALGFPAVSYLQKSDEQLKSAATSTVVTPAAVTQPTAPTISGTPSHISLPSRDISIDVAPGYYNAQNQTWTLGPDKAYFATITSEANNKTGNTFIYGHNRNQVFTRLLDAQIGDTAEVTSDNGYTFTYKLASMKDVDPTDTEVMDPTEAPTLSLQTCSGAWYQHRRIYTFTFVEVHKNV